MQISFSYKYKLAYKFLHKQRRPTKPKITLSITSQIKTSNMRTWKLKHTPRPKAQGARSPSNTTCNILMDIVDVLRHPICMRSSCSQKRVHRCKRPRMVCISTKPLLEMRFHIDVYLVSGMGEGVFDVFVIWGKSDRLVMGVWLKVA